MTKGFVEEIEMLLNPDSKDGVKGVFASDFARVRFGVFGCPCMRNEKRKTRVSNFKVQLHRSRDRVLYCYDTLCHGSKLNFCQ